MDIKKRRQLAFLYAKQVRLILQSVVLPEENFCITPLGDTGFSFHFQDDYCIGYLLVVHFNEFYCDPAKMWEQYKEVVEFFEECLDNPCFPRLEAPIQVF